MGYNPFSCHSNNQKGYDSTKTIEMNIIRHNKNILFIALGVGLILLNALTAMQFTEEMTWSPFDFAFAGTLLFGTGLVFELITRRATSTSYRAAVGIAVLAGMLLVWVNLAVGIIGSEDNPTNVLYLGVLAILILGSLLVRFRSQGMARTMFVTALAQLVVPLVALLVWTPEFSTLDGLLEGLRVVGVTGLFVVLWAAAGVLFRQAGVRLEREGRP